MNTSLTTLVTASSLIFATSGTVAMAQDSSASENPFRFTVGAIAAAGNSPFDADDDFEGALVPYFSVETGRIKFDPNGLSYGAYQSANSSIELLLAPRWLTADPADEPGLSTLDRETAVEAGLRYTHQVSTVEFSAAFLTDVSDTHDGHELNLGIATGLPLGVKTFVGLQASLSWNDANLASYRYGVREGEATRALAAYDVDETITPSIGIELSHQLSARATLIGGFEAEFLPDEVTSSPIVQRDTLYATFVGIAYEF